MRRYCIASMIVLILALQAWALPLLFKTTKEISADVKTDLFSFDATKYKQLRIGVTILRGDPAPCWNLSSKAEARTMLNSHKVVLERKRALFDGGNISQSSFDQYKKEVADAEAAVQTAREYPCSSLGIFSADGDERIQLGFLQIGKEKGQSMVIDSPPATINFTGYGEGKYSISIWGQ